MKFYDPDEIRAIPMINVARRLGLPVSDQGYTDCLAHWGSDATGCGSCSLREPDNYFRCPCGNSGWTTDLVVQAKKCSVVDAIQWLGAEFKLKPVRAPGKKDYVSRSRGLRPDTPP